MSGYWNMNLTNFGKSVKLNSEVRVFEGGGFGCSFSNVMRCTECSVSVLVQALTFE